MNTLVRPDAPRYDNEGERARGRGVWHVLGPVPGWTRCGRKAKPGWAIDWEGKVDPRSDAVCAQCRRSLRSLYGG